MKNAFIVPADTVTRMLFAAASAIMDKRSREKFKLIKSDDRNWWLPYFHEDTITISLGGSSSGFQFEAKMIGTHRNH